MTRDASHNPLTGVRVLVVDVDDDEREMLTYILETGGARVVAVATGAEALDAAEHERPDALVIDLRPPEADASRLAEDVRRRAARDGGRPVRAVALSGGELSSRDGFDAYLLKPVGLAELADAVAPPDDGR